MSLRINTNIAALTAHRSMARNDAGLSASLEKLSSGLRINKAADDASGMAIADSLKSQSLGLGQAIRNANDGISMVQTADGALDESINIVNTIKTKAIQAAQDGQTTESRKAIQSDIDKLLAELDNIAKTTAFNGQKLLSGQFTNKQMQIGAYSHETVSISIASAESNKVGHVNTSQLSFSGTGSAQLSLYSNVQDATYDINSIDISYNNNRENSLGAVSDAINKLSDVLGISSEAVVTSTTSSAVSAGTTDSDFAINGITIGQISVKANDSDGSLVKSINLKSSDTGVFASVDVSGKLTLTSTDGRAIKLTGTSITNGTNTGVNAILGQTDMSTLGVIKLTQTGAAEITISNSGDTGLAVSTSNDLETSGTTSATTVVSSIAAGSTLGSGTVLNSGTAISNNMTVAAFTTSGATVAGAGSVLRSGTSLATGTSVTSDITVGSTVVNGGATLVAATGSILQSGTVIGSGTTITSDIVVSGKSTTGNVTVGSGSILLSGTILNSGTVIQGSATIAAGDQANFGAGGGLIATGSVIATGSTLVSGTVFNTAADATAALSHLSAGGAITTGAGIWTLSFGGNGSGVTTAGGGAFTLTGEISTLPSGIDLQSGSVLKAGSYVANDDVTVRDLTVSGGTMTLLTG